MIEEISNDKAMRIGLAIFGFGVLILVLVNALIPYKLCAV